MTVPLDEATARSWLAVAVEEARAGLAEGGIPIGGALIGADGTVLGRGHNRRVQDDDPSVHGETDAFRNAGRQRTYRGTTMVTTLSPCWYCSGLVRQFGISRLVVGEARTFYGGHDWVAENGVEVLVLDDPECVQMMQEFIAAHPQLWNEDIGEDDESAATTQEAGR
jgi:cytosine/creatinine deaminase